MLTTHAIGHIIAETRRERGLTLRELSARSAVSLGYISEIERGVKEPTGLVIQALADGLDVSTGELLVAAGELLQEFDSLTFTDTSVRLRS
jgi:transcriptional regulator with XRE-family HTH domain